MLHASDTFQIEHSALEGFYRFVMLFWIRYLHFDCQICGVCKTCGFHGSKTESILYDGRQRGQNTGAPGTLHRSCQEQGCGGMQIVCVCVSVSWTVILLMLIKQKRGRSTWQGDIDMIMGINKSWSYKFCYCQNRHFLNKIRSYSFCKVILKFTVMTILIDRIILWHCVLWY